MATTRDRYILDVDTKGATRSIDQLKRSIDQLGGSQVQQRMKSLQTAVNAVDFAGLARETDQLKRRLDQLGSTRATAALTNLDRAAGSARVRMAALAGAAAGIATAFAGSVFAGFIRGASDAAVQSDRLKNSLTTFLGSAELAGQEMRRISTLASEMGVRVEDLGAAFGVFTRSGLDTSGEALKAWTNIALASGKSLDQLGEAVADALTGEFERLKEFGIKVSQSNGQFTAQIAGQQAIIAGSSEELINKLRQLGEAGGFMSGGVERNATTLEGSMARLSNSTRAAQVAFMEGLKPALIQVNLQMAEFLDKNRSLATALGQDLGTALVTLANAVEFLSSVFGTLKDFFQLALWAVIPIIARDVGLLFRSVLGMGGPASLMIKDLAVGFGNLATKIPLVGPAVAALITPVGQLVVAFAALDLALKQIGIEDGLFPDLIAQSSRVVDAVIADVNRLRGIDTIENLSFDNLVNSGLAAQTVVDELNRRYADGIAKLGTWQETLTMSGTTVERLKAAQAEIEKLTAEIAAAGAESKVTGQNIDQFMNSLSKTPSVSFYEQLIKDATAASNQATIFEEAMRGLNEALAKGVIAPQVYAEAMRKLNEQMNPIDPTSYVAFFDNLMTGARTGVRETEYLKFAIDDLQTAIVNGGTAEELAAWRAALEQLTPDSFEAFYSSIVTAAQGTVREAGYTQQAIEALNESLAKGVIGPEVYGAAMAQLTEAVNAEPLRTYALVLDELNQSFATSQATTAVNADVMAMLSEQYSAGIISLQQYAAGVTELGGSFDAYLLSIGDVDAYLRNLQTTVEASIAADSSKIDAIRQLTAEFEAGRVAPEIYAQMMQALGADIEFTSGQVRQLQTDFNALTGTAEASLSAMEQRVRAAQEQAELSGYEGVNRALRSITLEEERLRDATIERLRTQALANGVSEDVLNEQIGKIQEQTRATIAARQEAATVEEDNRQRLEDQRESMRGRTAGTRTPAPTAQTPSSWLDRIFGNDNASGAIAGGPNGSRSNPYYVIPMFGEMGGLGDAIGSIAKQIINASDLTGNITGTLQSLSAPLARANSGSLLGSLFGGYFATGGNIPPGRFGVVGESGAELVQGPASVTPLGSSQVTYNINAVDVSSFRDMLARDPSFVHAVVQRAQRRIPGGR